MPGGKCVFNDAWLQDIAYKDWLLHVAESRYKARCSMCNQTFDVSNMGEAALKYHMREKKHQNLRSITEKSKINIKDFFPAAKSQCDLSNNTGNSTASAVDIPDSSNMRSVVASTNINSECVKAEILWALKVLDSHYSYKSCDNVGYLFKTMFPDSEIAKNFTCGEKKTAYISVFGIAPYFGSLLKEKVRSESGYVLLFDESMNGWNYSKQLDCHVRFWNHDKVMTRYYTSDFLGHASSDILFEKINEKCLTLGSKNLLQLSMDGPNVNLKAFNQMFDAMKEEHNMTLLNVGTCGLHTVHNAFKAGCSVFPEIEQTASALVWLFKDSPARREDFSSLSIDVKFPLKFCKHRWLENESVLQRVLEILPDIKKYVKKITEKHFPKPDNKSFEIIQDSLKDVLFIAKCNFIISVVKELESFLKLYQTDKPMLAFLADDLHNLIKGLMQRFIKEESIPVSALKLLHINVEEKALYKDATKINVGFVTRKMLKNLNKEDKFSNEKKIMEFYINCRVFLIKLTKKLIEKCPLVYVLVRNLSCFDPRMLVSSKEANLNKLQNILLSLNNIGRIPDTDGDNILKQYENFVTEFSSLDTATQFRSCCDSNFDPVLDRLDVFYYEFLANVPKYATLWKLLQIILLLSHGQASVERGFSINKNLMVQNLENKSIVAKRTIEDHIRFVGGLDKIVITKEFMISVAGARQKYIAHLDEQKINKQHQISGEKRKLLNDSISDFKKKKRCLEIDISELNKSSDEFAEKAEKNSDLVSLSKSNALRRMQKKKVVNLKKCEDLSNMCNELKNI